MVFCSELIIEHDTKCRDASYWLMPRHGEGKVLLNFLIGFASISQMSLTGAGGGPLDPPPASTATARNGSR